MIFERADQPLPRWRDIFGHYDRHMASNAVVAWLFATTGPLVILFAVATQGGLSREDISSWIFGAYALGGVFSIAMSALYRQPIGMAWTIPGAVLVGPTLGHLPFAEVIGAYLVCGVVMLVLGVTGLVRKVMALIPMPIVMAMVSGVFLPFGLKIVSGFVDDFWIAFAVVAAFFVSGAVPAIGRILPPVLAALVVGVIAVVAMGHVKLSEPLHLVVAHPKLYAPRFSLEAQLELVLPLIVAVMGIQNSQGFAILSAADYKPPMNALTIVCGAGTILMGLLGSVPTCVTGPSNAIMCASGAKDQRYVAGIVYGALMLAFGVFAPLATQIGLALPTAFIGVLGGLAMARVLQSSLVASFGGDLTLGAMATFIVTLSNVTIFNIGSAFWGLVFGVMTSWLLERDALRKVWHG
ncbi:MAG TPA: benzoate/H(+) symporter BenE family transporter [Alphaproteobacteria bacterium]|nr:benzoate/H(+) symporter BenE family transporter [Alphaproteobacteria bacterium]